MNELNGNVTESTPRPIVAPPLSLQSPSLPPEATPSAGDADGGSPRGHLDRTKENLMNATLVIDPVCGMTIDPRHAAGTSQYDGTTFHFCAQSCKSAFDAAPGTYLMAEPSTGACCGGHCKTT